jgi:radical SAM protein with 4Fe4S-binding SPASM domain
MKLPVNIPILDIEIVRGCFLDCRWCPLDKSNPYQFMDIGLFRKIIDEADQIGAGYSRLLLFRSGEPFLYPEIPELLSIIAEKKTFRDITVEFYTNGMIHSPNQVRAIMESPLNIEVIFSADGTGNRESYEYTRPGAKWDTLSETIGMLSRQRTLSIYRSRKKLSVSAIIPDPSSVPFTVPDEETIKERFSKTFIPLGIDDFYYRGIHRWSGTRHLDGMPCRDNKEKGTCHFIRRGGISVQHDGKVSPCCADIEGDIVIGDLNSQSLEEVFYGHELRMMRKTMISGKRNSLPTCAKCDLI